jgi:cytidine deaminase
MDLSPLTDQDKQLIEVAQEVLRKNYVPGRHTCAAAVLTPGGAVFTGVSIQTCGYGTCAEPVALGAAFTSGERMVKTIVVVAKRFNNYSIVPPCGNCRQLLLDYVPDTQVIMDQNGALGKISAKALLPGVVIVDENY